MSTDAQSCNLCPWFDANNAERVAFKGKYHTIFFPKIPMVYREDGGHLILIPNRHVIDISDFTVDESVEYLALTQSVSKTLFTLLSSFKIPIGRINYHDNGNLEADKAIGAHQHLHFFGRSKNSVHQKWKSNLIFPDFDPKHNYYKNATHFQFEEREAIKNLLHQNYRVYASKFQLV